ncbi:MAG: hypothetical protein QOJ42_6942 [Acidobacteriaceae bacterium]|nr:hypothetical protein [Acidobacteriaceae bacterium]
MENVVGSDPEAPKVPSAWANNILFQVSRLEQKTLSALPVPFGSSLMVVGLKRIAT